MKNQTNPNTLGAITEIAVKDLQLDPKNPRRSRKTEHDPVLTASIASQGLLQNLGVAPSDKDATKYIVKYGSRRLRSLRHLISTGKLEDDTAVPCRMVASDDTDTFESQIAENVCRADMAPIDEYEAFAKLVTMGRSIEDIANRFGTTVRSVEQRLALGQAAPCVRAALRDEAITLDIAKLFAGCPDIARQERVFKAVTEANISSAWTIKRMIYESDLSSNDDAVKFVTLDAYEAAGGTVLRDLLSEDVYVTDLELLSDLTQQKLTEHVETLTAAGWSWVEAFHARTWELINGYDRIYGEYIEPSDEIKTQIDALAKEQQARYDAHEDADTWSDEADERYDAIEHELDDLRTSEYSFSDEQKSVAGCIIFPGPNGVIIETGMVRKGDRKRLNEVTGEAAPSSSDTTDDKPVHTQSHANDLATFRAFAVQAGLIRKPKLAVLFHQFCSVQPCLGDIYSKWKIGADISLSASSRDLDKGDISETPAFQIVDAAQNALRLDIFSSDDIYVNWLAFCDLNLKERDALVAFAVAKSIHSFSDNDTFMGQIANEMKVSLREYWTPTAENYFSRVRKDVCIAFLKDTLGNDDAARMTNNFKDKKADIVATCEAVINGTTPIDKAQRKSVDAWTPENMDFNPPALEREDEIREAA